MITSPVAEIAEQAEALALACRRLHARGLLAGAEGNLSVRLSDDTVLVTASGVDKAGIGVGQVLRVWWRVMDGAPYGVSHGVPELTSACPLHDGTGHEDGDRSLRPSSELEMHLACYAARPNVRGIVHAHPPAATGFATAGLPLPADVLPEVPVVVGPVALVPYGRPGTPALAAAMQPFLAAHEVFLLANHGVTAVGRTLTDALLRMESVEQAARIVAVARLLGGEQRLPAGEAAALASLHRSHELPTGSSPRSL
ncbi:class II aldolase/adducin family protein [Gemmatimonas aurantiaca]|uniref:class II aldolase/adducin family protein n=1 Tax=Gemmatimonas aurantiaca TaxID=173480 RepID=UPI00301D2EC1